METYYSTERNVQILIALLKENGIKKIVASPGSTNVCFVGSVQTDNYFEVYSCVDERSAAYMACGMSEETGEPVVLSCTGATASRNYMPALTEAYYRKLPIIAITSSQPSENIGQLCTQVTDRRQLPADVVVRSVQVPFVQSDEDKWNCEIQINKALLSCRQRGGGPVHINIITKRDRGFDVKQLPRVKAIKRYAYNDVLPDLPDGKKVVFIGSHRSFTPEETATIDAFCASQDAVVLYEMTSGYHGSYGIKYDLIAAQSMSDSPFKHMSLMIHFGEMAGGDFQSFLKPEQVWRISEDGEVKDPFRKLTAIFEMNEEAFFKNYIIKGSDKHQLYDSYKAETKRLYEKLDTLDIPLTNLWIAQQMSKSIPQGAEVHLGILNSFRTWNLFELPEGVHSFCNVGGYGIDGCVSSMIGASLMNADRLYFGVFGDLAFFYDMNVLGNRHIRNNVRILLINNGKGNEFHNPGQLWARSFESEDVDKFGSAAHHFGNKSPELVKHFSQDLGFEYMTADSKERFLELMPHFVSSMKKDKPMLFEVFTNGDDDAMAYKIIRSLEEDTGVVLKNNLKEGIKNVFGDSTARKLKSLFAK